MDSPMQGNPAEAYEREALLRDMNAALQSYADEDGLAFPIDTHVALAYR